jgi:hypothetical protein
MGKALAQQTVGGREKKSLRLDRAPLLYKRRISGSARQSRELCVTSGKQGNTKCCCAWGHHAEMMLDAAVTESWQACPLCSLPQCMIKTSAK